MKTLKDLFEHQLKDLYSAEGQLLEALPKMVENASDKTLKKSFKEYLKSTEEHKNHLAKVCKEMDISPTGEMCKAMEGLVKEAKGFLEEDAKDEVKDVGLIAEMQRIAHYAISGYGTAIRYAKELDMDSIAEKLQTSLDEEYAFDEELTDMAEDRLNRKAMKDS